MITITTRINEARELIIDNEIMERAGLKIGDEVHVALHGPDGLMITPVKQVIGPEGGAASAGQSIGPDRELFNRLSQ